MLLRVCQWVVPLMDFSDGGWWTIDDTGLPKQGRHSAGVACQHCGMLGKQDNCQVAVSVSLACAAASIPVAWQLYLPREWDDDPARRDKAGIPEALEFATKPAIALQQIEHLMGQGAPRHCVLADAGYGVDTAFRARLSALGLRYCVGVTGSVTVWPPGREPLPAPAYGGAVAWPRDCAWAVPLCRNTIRNRSRRWPWNSGPSIGTPSRGAKERTPNCARASPVCECAQHTGTTCAMRCANPSGCSSSGPRVTQSRSNTGCPRCPKTLRSAGEAVAIGIKD